MSAGLFGITITREDCRPAVVCQLGKMKHRRGIEKIDRWSGIDSKNSLHITYTNYLNSSQSGTSECGEETPSADRPAFLSIVIVHFDCPPRIPPWKFMREPAILVVLSPSTSHLLLFFLHSLLLPIVHARLETLDR